MRRMYEEPEVQIRNYVFSEKDVIMTSDPNDSGGNNNDLDDGDDNDYNLFP